MSQEKELSSEDINKIIETQNSVNRYETIKIFGKNIDKYNFIIGIIVTVLWTLIWIFCGLFSINKYTKFIYMSSLIIITFNTFNIQEYTRTDPETESYNFERQTNNIEGVLGIYILLFIFLFNININNNFKIIVSKVLILSIIICCISIYIFNTKYTSDAYRRIKIFQQKMFNASMILFTLSLYIIYYALTQKV